MTFNPFNLLIGIIFNNLIFTILTGELIRSLWTNANLAPSRKKRYVLQTFLLGFFESTFYFGLFAFFLSTKNLSDSIASIATIIGGYLTVKTLSSVWKEKLSEDRGKTPPDKKRDRGTPGEKFNIYLIGNLSSLLLSFIAATFATSGNYQNCWSIFIFLIIPTSVILFMVAVIKTRYFDD